MVLIIGYLSIKKSYRLIPIQKQKAERKIPELSTNEKEVEEKRAREKGVTRISGTPEDGISIREKRNRLLT